MSFWPCDVNDKPLIRTPFEKPPDPGKVIEVAAGVLWARIPLPIRLNHVNVYILEDADGWTIIDTGLNLRPCIEAWTALIAGPLRGRPVVRVVVTHHHFDHIGRAGWFQEQGAELWTTRTAWLYGRMLNLDRQTEVPSETIAFYRAAGMPEELIKKRLKAGPFNTSDAVAPLPLGFVRIAEGSTLQIGGRIWDVRIGEGHAPEQATLWCRDDALVLGADQFLPNISPNISLYPTMPLEDPVGDWIDSCTRLRAFARDDQLVLPGHKLPYRGLPLRLDQLIDNHHAALDRLLKFLEAPKTAVECFQPLFMRTIGEGEYGLAMGEAMAHCAHLWHRGKVTRDVDEMGRWLWRAKRA